MHRHLALIVATILLAGCWPRQTPLKPEPLPQAEVICPSWVDKAATPALKRKLAGELRSAPQDALWPDVVVADVKLKNQLKAAGCKAVLPAPLPVVINPAVQ